MEKAWFYEMFFQVVIAMVKDKKRCTIIDTTSIKISFIHYRNYITQTRVKLPLVFEEFNLVYVFLAPFSSHCQLIKSQQYPVDLATFTEEILNGKLPFFVQCVNKTCWQGHKICSNITWPKTKCHRKYWRNSSLIRDLLNTKHHASYKSIYFKYHIIKKLGNCFSQIKLIPVLIYLKY